MKSLARPLLTSLALATAALACVSANAADKELLIGVNDSLTGPGAVYGLPQANSVQMAADEINAAGGEATMIPIGPEIDAELRRPAACELAPLLAQVFERGAPPEKTLIAHVGVLFAEPVAGHGSHGH